MSVRALSACLAGLLAALALSACGEGERDAVERSFSDLRRAYLKEDYRSMCRLMTSRARREVGNLGHELTGRCPDDLAGNFSAAVVGPRDRFDPTIEDVAISGDRARVTANLAGASIPRTVTFVKESGGWKLDEVFAHSAPPPKDLE
jgi:hypothetical protein